MGLLALGLQWQLLGDESSVIENHLMGTRGPCKRDKMGRLKFALVVLILAPLMSRVVSAVPKPVQRFDPKVRTVLWTRDQDYISLVGCTVDHPSQINLQVHIPPNTAEIVLGNPKKPSLIWNLAPRSTSGKVPVSFLHSNPGDTKYVSAQSLKEISDFVLVPLKRNAGTEQGQLWQPLIEEGAYVTQKCQNASAPGEFMMFRLVDLQSKKTLAKVGIRLEDMTIFNRFQLMTAAEIFPTGSEGSVDPKAQNLAGQVMFRPKQLPAEVTPEKEASVNPAVATKSVVAAKKPSISLAATKAYLANRVNPTDVGEKSAISLGELGVPRGSAIEQIVCVNSSKLNVRDDSLKNVRFQVDNHDSAKIFQEWSKDKFRKTIAGQTYSFIKVQFPSRPFGNDMGWVAENFIKSQVQCPSYRPTSPQIATAKPSGTSGIGLGSGSSSSGLLSSFFPTIGRPFLSYKEGGRMFGSSRDSGRRLHAGVDLFRNRGEEVRAVSDGVVISDRYPFYEGTYAIEVRQQDGSVIRYGEILGLPARGASMGQRLQAGQNVGFVGKVDSGSSPMLHLEMYSGAKTGALTDRTRSGYLRRADLINPTTQVSSWERSTFGSAY